MEQLSPVADATRLPRLSIPALKRRAKFKLTLRVENHQNASRCRFLHSLFSRVVVDFNLRSWRELSRLGPESEAEIEHHTAKAGGVQKNGTRCPDFYPLPFGRLRTGDDLRRFVYDYFPRRP
jgi:hypothetical protein